MHTLNPVTLPVGRTLVLVLIFSLSYLTTITVRAQDAAPNAIQLNSSNNGSDANISVTGTITEATENYVMIGSGGKRMQVMLNDTNLEGDSARIFSPGMNVSVNGRVTGDDFGTPVIRAVNITASQPAPPPPAAMNAPAAPAAAQTMVH